MNIFYSMCLIALALQDTQAWAQSFPKKYAVDRYQSRPRNPIAKNVLKRTGELPEKVDLMENQTAVKDQDMRGACSYFAVSAQIESEIKRVTKKEVNLSEEYLIRYGKGLLGHSDGRDGADVNGVLKVIKIAGFALERDIPYQPDWFDGGLPCDGIEKKSEEALNKGCYSHNAPTDEMQAKAIKADELTLTKTDPYSGRLVDDIKALLAEEGITTVVGVPVNFKGWDDTTGNAYFSDELQEECDERPDACGGHAVLIVGYDDDLEAVYDGKEVKGAFIFKNSWGHGWGKNGYGKFPYEMIQNWADRTSNSKLSENFILPLGAEASAPVPVKIENILFAHEIDAEGNLISKVSARVTGAPNVMLYASTFVTDDAQALLKANGAYVRAPYYQLLNNDGYAILENAVMKIKKNTWDEVVAYFTPAFLRVSLYVLSDTEASTVLTREFIAL